MAKVVSIINLKGGVGKTTTTVQIAECLSSEFGKRVLVIDLDPQTNATIALIDEAKWEELDSAGNTIFHLFNDKLEGSSSFNFNTALQSGVSNLLIPNLSLLASSIRFIDIQDRVTEIPAKTGYSLTPMEILKSAIHPHLGDFDYILIDCPPNLGFITRNGIEISDYYLIPTIPDTLSTYGIPQIIATIKRFSIERPLGIRCLGLVVTKFDSRSSSHARGMRSLPARLQRIFEDLELPSAPVFDSIIPQSNRTSELMEFANRPNSFKEKYGHSRSGGRPLHEYVTNLTREFVSNAR